MSSVVNIRETLYRKTMSCPVHDRGHQDRPLAPTAFGRSKSIDNGYARLNVSSAKRGALQRDLSADSGSRGRKPFLHSHSVNCAIVSNNLPPCKDKARSIGSLAVPPRPRPNVLELCPNQNTSFNAYRRRYSRSSDRSLDFDNCYLNEFGSTSSNIRYYRRSSSRDSGRSFQVFPGRNEAEGQGRWTNLRKGMSLLSLCAGNDDFEEDQRYQPTRILRPPTRHFYRKGLSGLPVKCSAKYMGLAY